jgi:signal transduction histidine kinase
MSIRLRLALLYSAILALTLVAFSGALYGVQARYTMNVHRRELAAQARLISASLTRMFTEGGRRPPRLDAPRPDAREVGGLRELRIRDHVSLLDLQGILLDHPINQSDDPLSISPESLSAVRSGQTWSEIVVQDGERYLVYSSPVWEGAPGPEGAVAGFVQVGRSLADRDRSLRALGTALIAGSALITLAAFGIGWMLSGLSLQPIERITQSAREIGAERDLSRRVPYRGPNDEVGRLAATLNDTLSELEDAHQQLENALELQRNFVADVSHELRTPLTTLRGNLALLRRRPALPEKEQKDILDDVVSESERLIRLVADLLTLARAEAGRLLHVERVPVATLVEETCRQARLLDPQRTIVDEAPGAEAVLADPNALKQVLLILLDNAILHGQGEVRVTVQRETAHDGVSISVRDQGPGIAPEAQARLFERFYRGERATHKPGLGLGLTIAQALVEAQEGTLSVESRAGQESTFTVSLPPAPD